MIINGKEAGFVYTIGVMCEISDYVTAHPDISGARLVIMMALEMNKAYCKIHGGDPVTEADIFSMPGSKFEELEKTVTAVQQNDSEPSIDIEPVKEKGKKKDPEEKQN